ncbi:hypothetical protein MKC55_21060 [[Clostridium] innocuum]|nr:hypothetical protein [[Clostridium] innocuum]
MKDYQDILQSIFDLLNIDLKIEVEKDNDTLRMYHKEDLVGENQAILSIINEERTDYTVFSKEQLEIIRELAKRYEAEELFQDLFYENVALLHEEKNENIVSLKNFLEETSSDEVTIEDRTHTFVIVMTEDDFQDNLHSNKRWLMDFLVNNLQVQKILSEHHVFVDMDEVTHRFIDDMSEREGFLEDVQDAIMNNDEQYCEGIIEYYNLNEAWK